MDACADESLYHFTATVSHTNFNKTVHLVHLGGWDRSGFQWGGYSTNFYTGRFRPKVQPLTLFDREGSTPFVFLPLANVTTFTYLV